VQFEFEIQPITGSAGVSPAISEARKGFTERVTKELCAYGARAGGTPALPVISSLKFKLQHYPLVGRVNANRVIM
jgi:hypothetical protein